MKYLGCSIALLIVTLTSTMSFAYPDLYQIPNDSRAGIDIVLDGVAVSLHGEPLVTTLIADAAEATGCAPKQVTGHWVNLGSSHTPFKALLVDGCGQRTVYSYEAFGPGPLPVYTLSRVSLKRLASSPSR